MKLFGRKPPLTDSRRRSVLEHSTCELSHGTTHYEVAGPRNGPPVVLIHGLTSSLFIWDEQFYRLAENGYRVLRYDLYGRGLSDRP
ncbi:MAG: alpha/beta fold hydrolase [bacterium]